MLVVVQHYVELCVINLDHCERPAGAGEMAREGVMLLACGLRPQPEDELIDKVRALPPNKQQEVLRLLDTLASGASSEPKGTSVDRRPIWEIVEEVNAALPADTWDDVPTDGSINLDHYLYGAPKQQS